MENEVIAEGVRRFTENASAELHRSSDVVFEVKFPGEKYSTLIGVEGLGFVVSYATYCGALSGTSLAPTLLLKNWGGVEGTCFYFSAHVHDGQPWLVLETRQCLDPDLTSEDVASILGFCRLQWLQARETFERS